MSKMLYQIYSGFLDIFFPKRCVLCGKEGGFLCIDCAKEIEITQTSVCPSCGKITQYCAFCPSCKKKLKLQLSGVYICSSYDVGPVKDMIFGLKYSGISEIAIELGEVVYQRVNKKLPAIDIIVPVPLHKKREAKRGYNQSEILARILSQKLHKPGGIALERIKNTESQINLSRIERRNNVCGAFSCQDPEFVKGKSVLLIDDVTTTFSTLNECAKVLKDSGAKKIWGVVIAKRN